VADRVATAATDNLPQLAVEIRRRVMSVRWPLTADRSAVVGLLAASLAFYYPLVFLGRISYGAYLSHLPLLGVYMYYLQPINAFSIRGLVIFVIWFASVILVSWLSFRFIELPFLRIKNRLGGRAQNSRSDTAISRAPAG